MASTLEAAHSHASLPALAMTLLLSLNMLASLAMWYVFRASMTQEVVWRLVTSCCVAICPLRWAGVVADVKVVELGSDPSCPPRDASGHCFDLLHKTRRWLAVEDEEDSEVEHLLPESLELD